MKKKEGIKIRLWAERFFLIPLPSQADFIFVNILIFVNICVGVNTDVNIAHWVDALPPLGFFLPGGILIFF